MTIKNLVSQCSSYFKEHDFDVFVTTHPGAAHQFISGSGPLFYMDINIYSGRCLVNIAKIEFYDDEVVITYFDNIFCRYHIEYQNPNFDLDNILKDIDFVKRITFFNLKWFNELHLKYISWPKFNPGEFEEVFDKDYLNIKNNEE